MPLSTIPELIALLRDNEMLPVSQSDSIFADLEASGNDIAAGVQWLVSRKWLTNYQGEQLLQGNPERLFPEPYILLEPLGEGGMGTVFKARHRFLDRIVALKLIRDDRISTNTEAIRRFQREARAAAQLSHPNIVIIYDASRSGDTHFIAMEYVEGIDLSKLVQRNGRLPILQACDFVYQAALGLQHAHERGMVHRDIKPSNLLAAGPVTRPAPAKPGLSGIGSIHDLRRPQPRLVTPGTQPPSNANLPSVVIKILDMGLARLARTDFHENQSALTQTGSVIGTPDYIAPEQARDASRVDIRADLYSLGCTFYFLLTGQPPFPTGSAMEKLLMHQLDEPQPLGHLRSDVPAEVNDVVRKLMAKRPDDRFATPQELADELLSVTTAMKPPPESQRRSGVVRPVERPSSNRNTPVPADTSISQEAPTPAQAIPGLAVGSKSAEESTLETKVEARPPAVPRGLTPVVLPQILDAETRIAPGRPTSPSRRIANVEGHTGAVAALAFTSDRCSLVSVGDDGTARLWGVAGNDLVQRSVVQKHGDRFRAAAFSPNDRMLAIGSGSQGGLVRLYELAELKPQELGVFTGHNGAVDAIAFSPDGKQVACGGEDVMIRLWDAVGGYTNKPRNTHRGHTGAVTALAFSLDGVNLASASLDGTVRLWTPGRAWSKERAALEQGCEVDALAFSTDGTTLAVGCRDHAIRIWDLSSLKPVKRAELRGHTGRIRLLLPTADGRVLVSVADGPQLFNWDSRTGELTREWLLPRMNATRFSLTHDGRYLAIGTLEGKIALYRVAEKRS
jgi:serine/threonine-protein kinase